MICTLMSVTKECTYYEESNYDMSNYDPNLRADMPPVWGVSQPQLEASTVAVIGTNASFYTYCIPKAGNVSYSATTEKRTYGRRNHFTSVISMTQNS